MFFVLGKLLLIFAVSLDSFGVGISYGLRRIKIPLIGLLIIMLCSGTMVMTSMTIGILLTSYISFEVIEIFGGLILISIGLISLYSAKSLRKAKKLPLEIQEQPKNSKQIHGNRYIKRLKLIFTVLKSSQEADVDRNGSISIKEGFLLGIVLGLDAFGAGLGAALIGYTPFLTSVLIAVVSASFVYIGIKSGFMISKFKWSQELKFLPPCLLIAIGIFYMI